MEFQESINSLKEYLNNNKRKILNPKRVQDIIEAYHILKEILKNEHLETRVEIVPGALELGDISIRTISTNITTWNPAGLAKIIQKCDSIDIYPTNDDRIKLDIQFQNAYQVEIV